jgi:uncharacterized protein
MNLREFFSNNPNCAIAFSGGVDSSYLLHQAVLYGKNIKAYFIKTPFQPQFEIDDAKEIADLIGANLNVIEYDILKNEKVSKNDPHRCYYCKKELFGNVLKIAKADGFDLVLDGTNASDDFSDRPGMKALEELKVVSPLRDCGLTKEKIRKLSKKAGLPTHNKPAYACLATRVLTDTKITYDILEKIEKAEKFMSRIGFSDFRVRFVNSSAKIQLKERQFSLFFKHRKIILNELSEYFNQVLLDLKSR